MSQANSQPCHLDNVKIYNLFDEMVLYSPRHEMAFSLNYSARAIWDLCDGQHTVLEISQELGQNFNGSAVDLLSDVTATVDQFHSFGLLTLV